MFARSAKLVEPAESVLVLAKDRERVSGVHVGDAAMFHSAQELVHYHVGIMHEPFFLCQKGQLVHGSSQQLDGERQKKKARNPQKDSRSWQRIRLSRAAEERRIVVQRLGIGVGHLKRESVTRSFSSCLMTIPCNWSCWQRSQPGSPA